MKLSYVTIQDKIMFVYNKMKFKFTYVLNVTYKIKLSFVTWQDKIGFVSHKIKLSFVT